MDELKLSGFLNMKGRDRRVREKVILVDDSFTDEQIALLQEAGAIVLQKVEDD